MKLRCARTPHRALSSGDGVQTNRVRQRYQLTAPAYPEKRLVAVDVSPASFIWGIAPVTVNGETRTNTILRPINRQYRTGKAKPSGHAGFVIGGKPLKTKLRVSSV